MEATVKVLDKGYVRLVQTMGSDLTVANAARVSYNKESHEMTDKDERLIRFLAKHEHFSPFRHQALTFECYVPLFVARQWWKHHIASTYVDDQNGWNESSRRYTSDDLDFYIPSPTEWRSKAETNKQGSGAPIETHKGMYFTDKLIQYIGLGEELYNNALEAGIAPEIARSFLPANNQYIRFYWTVSLQGLAHFLNLRIPKDAQKEIQDYARAVEKLAVEKFPIALKELKTYGQIR